MRTKMTFPQALALIALSGITAGAAAASAAITATAPPQLVASAVKGKNSGPIVDCKKHPKDPHCKK